MVFSGHEQATRDFSSDGQRKAHLNALVHAGDKREKYWAKPLTEAPVFGVIGCPFRAETNLHATVGVPWRLSEKCFEAVLNQNCLTSAPAGQT